MKEIAEAMERFKSHLDLMQEKYDNNKDLFVDFQTAQDIFDEIDRLISKKWSEK